MLWLKTFHIIFMVTWMAGIFYLPRLFVYHAMADDPIGVARFKIMERKLFWGIMTPGAIITVGLGLVMLYTYAWAAYKAQGWLHAKLLLVGMLCVYHVYCGKLMVDFKHDRNRKSHRWFRVFNELPVFLLMGITILVVVRPF